MLSLLPLLPLVLQYVFVVVDEVVVVVAVATSGVCAVLLQAGPWILSSSSGKNINILVDNGQ